MLLAGPISHDSLQLLTATADFVALCYFTGRAFSFVFCFLWWKTNIHSILKFRSVFLGHVE